MTKETVGKVSSELLVKQVDDQHSAVEQMQEQLTDYENNLMQCLVAGKSNMTGDFYIVVLTKKERLMRNVIRNYFFYRSTCPTPEWDQILYKYSRIHDALEFMWVVPSKDTCQHMTQNALLVPSEERILLSFVLSFNDGTLLTKAKQLNGEKAESPFLEEN